MKKSISYSVNKKPEVQIFLNLTAVFFFVFVFLCVCVLVFGFVFFLAAILLQKYVLANGV